MFWQTLLVWLIFLHGHNPEQIDFHTQQQQQKTYSFSAVYIFISSNPSIFKHAAYSFVSFISMAAIKHAFWAGKCNTLSIDFDSNFVLSGKNILSVASVFKVNVMFVLCEQIHWSVAGRTPTPNNTHYRGLLWVHQATSIVQFWCRISSARSRNKNFVRECMR